MLISEIFNSYSGEVCPTIPVGADTTFVRTAGCNLNCAWCDAPYTQDSTRAQGNMSPKEVYNAVVENIGCHSVLITGGEPLLQPLRELEDLCALLVTHGHYVGIETNGTMVPSAALANMHIGFVFDVKMPSSGHYGQSMDPSDMYRQVAFRVPPVFKFVCMDTQDLGLALAHIKEAQNTFQHSPPEEFHNNLLPTFAIGMPLDKSEDFSQAVKNSGVRNIVLNLQVHKIANWR